MGKSLVGSKTFWINLLGSAISVLGSGVVPPKYSIPIMGAINIINRLLTGVPITSVLPK